MVIGSSKSSLRRQRRASRDSHALKQCGDKEAARRLLFRGRALMGIAKHGWKGRLALAMAANRARVEGLRQAKGKAALLKRELDPFMLSSRDPSN
jgi:hypothetical protein